MREEIIGDCRLILGDCRGVEPSISYDSLASDPPFGMEFVSNHRAVKHRAIVNDASDDLLQWACGLRPAHSSYVFCRWDNIAALPKPKSLVTWVKNNWSMGDLEHEHARQTEVICFYPGAGHFFPDGRPTDVVTAPRTGNDNHPTEKPVSLMVKIVRWTDGVVFDPFMGSGTTGVACVETGRAFVGCEIDPSHYETALRRVEAAYKQPRLFAEPIAKPVQETLAL